MIGGLLSRLPLLQFRINPSLFDNENPDNAILILSIIGAVIVITVIIGLIQRSRYRPTSSRSPGLLSLNYRRAAAGYGLSNDQRKLLSSIFRNGNVRDPERVIQTPTSLDRVFHSAYRSIERNSRTDDAAQRLLTELFTLRNTLDNPPSSGASTGSRVAANTPAILVVGKETYSVRVLSSEGLAVVTEVPRNALGTALRLTRGTAVTISFFTQSSKGFSLEGRISEAVSTGSGIPGLKIIHNGKVKTLVKRNFRRKQCSLNCEYYHVNLEVISQGRRKTSRLVTSEKSWQGNLLDISAGGCSMRTSNPPSVGSRLKISIEHNNTSINVLGMVLRTNRSPGYGTILHIKFIKVPRKSFNSISAIVFGYDSRELA